MGERLFTTEHGSGRDDRLDVYYSAAITSGIPRADMQVFPGRHFGKPMGPSVVEVVTSEAVKQPEGVEL